MERIEIHESVAIITSHSPLGLQQSRLVLEDEQWKVDLDL
jgi:hypothetical protein